MMKKAPEILLQGASLASREGLWDIVLKGGEIESISASGTKPPSPGTEVFALSGDLVIPPLVDSHFHLDSVFTYGEPRVNASGTLKEGIALWKERKKTATETDVFQRAEKYLHWAIAQGIGAIRSHVDVSCPGLPGVRALVALREKYQDWITIQLVAFPQDGLLSDAETLPRLREALDLGVEVVGGIPHGESTYEKGQESVRVLCREAAERGLRIDLHCDETDDPASDHLELFCDEVARLGLGERAAGSHLCALASMEEEKIKRIIAKMAAVGMNAIPNPLINLTLQGRQDFYPKRRGLMPLKEMLEAGINVSPGHDCVLDPWYSFGQADMLEVASMACHAGHLTGSEEFPQMLQAVTFGGARTLGLAGYGMHEGASADLVVLGAKDVFSALRLRPVRKYVFRKGQLLSRRKEVPAEVCLDGRETVVDFAYSFS
ncbi:MAG: amidohydrolase family protein [Opitutales bacterium]|nr:amidohydrolase family protein [Opitutales bacterium]MCH8541604.1 amidohydrolase family protein [Opitutales bacterium]